MSNVTRVLLAGVVAFQVCSIVVFGAYQEFLVQTGTQVTLRTIPVDPRDLFRGEYVDLRYDISTLHVSEYGAEVIGGYCCISSTANTGDQVVVGLVQRSDQEFATISPIASSQLELNSGENIYYVNRVGVTDKDGTESQKDVTIKGTIQEIRQLASHKEYHIEYGIESFFIPEGTGSDIEVAEDLKVVVVLSSRGHPVIANLIVDGDILYSR